MEFARLSQTNCVYSVTAALLAAEDIEGMGPHRHWRWQNAFQSVFLHDYFEICRYELMSIPEIECVASRNCEVINRFLCDRGFDIMLNSFGPDQFGTASVLDLLVKWLTPGEIVTITAPDKRRFPGVRLKGVQLRFWLSGTTVVTEVATESQDTVCLAMIPEPSGRMPFELLKRAIMLEADVKRLDGYGAVIFPMVNLDQRTDISWLEGMLTIAHDRRPAIIREALQQNKLRMNELGARVHSASVICSLGGAAPAKEHVINQPFLVWFKREGVLFPLFVAYVGRDDWQNPCQLAG